MFVRLVLQKIHDGVERADFIFLHIIPVDDVRQVGAAQIKDQQNAEQDAAEPSAFAGKNSREDEDNQNTAAAKIKRNQPTWPMLKLAIAPA